jgi:hypothetical protein
VHKQPGVDLAIFWGTLRQSTVLRATRLNSRLQIWARMDGFAVKSCKHNRFCFYPAVVESFESRSVDNLLFLQSSLEAVDLFMQL